MISLPNLATCKRIGFIVPSSNTAVEPITQAIFQSLNLNIICIFTRIQVRTLGSDAKSGSQFSTETKIQPARLLADAAPDCILWHGTSGMWIPDASLTKDFELARAMQNATGIPCSTNTIATVEALNFIQARNVSIAVPYTEALTAKVAQFFHCCGFEVTAAERLIPTPGSNLEIAQSRLEDIKAVIKRSALGSDAIIVACTNWPASGMVQELESELGITIMDSIVVTAWWALRMLGLKAHAPVWVSFVVFNTTTTLAYHIQLLLRDDCFKINRMQVSRRVIGRHDEIKDLIRIRVVNAIKLYNYEPHDRNQNYHDGLGVIDAYSITA